jgi:hypothetical protein
MKSVGSIGRREQVTGSCLRGGVAMLNSPSIDLLALAFCLMESSSVLLNVPNPEGEYK